MKSKLITLITIITLLVISTIPAFASSPANVETRVEHYADGSYAVITTVEETQATPFAATSTKSVKTTYKYYNQDNKLAWDFALKGSFSYDTKTAKATAASTSYNVYVSGWKCSSKDSWTTGATAKGKGTFKYGILTKNVELGLKCSPNGTVTAV